MVNLLCASLLAVSVGVSPLKSYDHDTLTDNGWQRVPGDGQKRYLQILLNDGRVHPINNVNQNMAYDEACYYVANWWSNEKVTNAQNYTDKTRLLGFYYSDTIVFTEYTTRYSFPIYTCSMRNFKGKEQTSLRNTWNLTDSQVPLSAYMSTLSETNNYVVYDDGAYIYGNFNDILGVKENLYYVRGDDVFFRTDVLCGVTIYDTWDDFVGYVYHDDEYQLGFTSGYANGRQEGYVNGYDKGKSDGYQSAKDNYEGVDNGPLQWISKAFDSVGHFFSIEIGGGFTIGLLFAIPVALSILIFIFKLLGS